MLATVLVYYLCIGGVLGAFSFAIARRLFKDHPFRNALSPEKMLLESIVWNMLTWPKILFWLLLIAVVKIAVLFRPRSRNR